MYRISVQKRTFPLLNVLIVRTLLILHHLPSSPPSCNVQPRPTGPTPCSFFIWFFLIFVYNWSNLVKYTYKQMLNSSFLLLVLLVLSSFSRWTVPHIWSGSWRWVSKLPIMILRCCCCFFLSVQPTRMSYTVNSILDVWLIKTCSTNQLKDGLFSWLGKHSKPRLDTLLFEGKLEWGKMQRLHQLCL